MLGGEIGEISVGRIGGSSIALLQIGTWRHCPGPALQSQSHRQADAAGDADRAKATPKVISRQIRITFPFTTMIRFQTPIG